MKLAVLAVLATLLSAPAIAGEEFSGTHTYRFEQETWSPMADAGWRTVTMTGDYVPISGPIPAGKIQCRGTNYWHGSIREADGVCVFGEGADIWMLRYHMTRTDTASQTAERFRRIGEWKVVSGTGRWRGITGSGFYWAEEGYGADGTWRTRWGGEVTIPK